MKRQKNTVLMMVWELQKGFQELMQTLIKIPKQEAQWKPFLHSRSLETLKQWNEKGNDWIVSQTLDPVSTIEYKVLHLAQCKLMYDEYAFRKSSLKWSDLECPEWPMTVSYLEQTQADLLDSIQHLNDSQLDELVPTNWGDVWPIKEIIFTMIHHDAYHFGQICTVRNLYKIENGN
jgi:hypothetical protein